MVQEYVKRQVKANHCSPRYLAVGVSAVALPSAAGGVNYLFNHLADVEQFVVATREPVQVHVDELNGYLHLRMADCGLLVRAAPGEVLIFDTSIRRFTVASVAFFARNYTVLEGLDGKEGGGHAADVH